MRIREVLASEKEKPDETKGIDGDSGSKKDLEKSLEDEGAKLMKQLENLKDGFISNGVLNVW